MSSTADGAQKLCGRLGQMDGDLINHVQSFLPRSFFWSAATQFARGSKKSQLFALVGAQPHESQHAGVLAVAIEPHGNPICGMCGEDWTAVYEEGRGDEDFEPPGCWFGDMFVSKVPVFPGCRELPLTKRACDAFEAGMETKYFNHNIDSFFCHGCVDRMGYDFRTIHKVLGQGADLFRFMSRHQDSEGYTIWKVKESCSNSSSIHFSMNPASPVIGEKMPGEKFRGCKKGQDWVMLLDGPGFVRIHQGPSCPRPRLAEELLSWAQRCVSAIVLTQLRYTDEWRPRLRF